MAHKFKTFLSDSKNWAISYLLVVQLDMMMTLVGTHKFGTRVEYNPFIRTAIEVGDYKHFLYVSLATAGIIAFVIMSWNKRKGEELSRQSRYLRRIAWLIIPLYFFAAPFGWIWFFVK